MSQTFTKGTVNVTGSVTSTASTRTAIVSSANDGYTNATTTVLTVPAGKTWRILHLSLYCCPAGTVSGALIEMLLNGVTTVGIKYDSLAATAFVASRAIEWNYDSAPVLTQNQVIAKKGNAGLNGGWSVSYVEE